MGLQSWGGELRVEGLWAGMHSPQRRDVEFTVLQDNSYDGLVRRTQGLRSGFEECLQRLKFTQICVVSWSRLGVSVRV